LVTISAKAFGFLPLGTIHFIIPGGTVTGTSHFNAKIGSFLELSITVEPATAVTKAVAHSVEIKPTTTPAVHEPAHEVVPDIWS